MRKKISSPDGQPRNLPEVAAPMCDVGRGIIKDEIENQPLYKETNRLFDQK